MSDNANKRKERLERLRDEAISLLREELLDVLRDEWRRGCDNAAIPGGMDTLRDEYAKVAPRGVFVVLRYYSQLSIVQRQRALTIAGKILRNKMLTTEEIEWIKDVATPPKSDLTSNREQHVTPKWKRVRESLRADNSGYSSRQLAREDRQRERGEIKGNINSETGEKIYHVPGQKWYHQTKITAADGER